MAWRYVDVIQNNHKQSCGTRFEIYKKIEKPPNEVAKRDPYMSPQYDVAVVMKPSPPVSDACCTLDLINYRYVCLQQLQKSSFLVIRRAFIRSYAIE